MEIFLESIVITFGTISQKYLVLVVIELIKVVILLIEVVKMTMHK